MKGLNCILSAALGLTLLGVVSCQSKVVDGGGGVAFDPSKPIVVSGFYPDSGGIATSMIITGENFGSDTTGLRVLYVDEDGQEHIGGLISSNGSRIYCNVPKGLTYKRDITIKVRRNQGEKTHEVVAEDHFIYKTQTSVITVIGQPNDRDQPTVPRSLTSTTLSAPSYVCLDDEDNIFIAERGDNYQSSKRSNGNGVEGNLLMASIPRDEVRFLQEGTRLINAPAFSDEKDAEAVYVPEDDGFGFYALNKAVSYAAQRKIILPDEETSSIYGANRANWKFSFVVNKNDKKIYTLMYGGELLRIDPKTRKITLLLRQVAESKPAGNKTKGSDSFLAFSPINTNRLFISRADANEIWYVDVDQLESKDKEEYHGEKYAGKAIWEGQNAGKGWEDGLLRNAKFNHPAQITFTSDGKMYIADMHNHCIRIIDTSVSDDKAVVKTLVGTPGSAGFKDGTPDVAKFRRPKGVAVSADGSEVYVADKGNRCIRRLSIQ